VYLLCPLCARVVWWVVCAEGRKLTHSVVCACAEEVTSAALAASAAILGAGCWECVPPLSLATLRTDRDRAVYPERHPSRQAHSQKNTTQAHIHNLLCDGP